MTIDSEFASNSSWRFVEAAYEFPNPQDPWMEVFPEVININNLSEDMMESDFVAVKIGDVNGSALVNSLMREDRTMSGTFELSVDEQILRAGETYEVAITTDELSSVEGYQFTLDLDPALVSVTNIDFGLLQAENVGLTRIEEGVITVSWNAPNGAVTAGEELITISLTASADANLSEAMHVSSRYTKAEAYAVTGGMEEVVIRYSTGEISGVQYELYQNVPNPFVTTTMIGFYLPQAGEASLTIRDAKGQLIRAIEGNYARGYNNVTIERDDLPTGVLYYTLESGDYTATRRMIIIE